MSEIRRTRAPAGDGLRSVISELKAEAELFRSLHVPGRPLLLANAWDAASARVAERAGAAAVATTSSGSPGPWAPRTATTSTGLALELTARVAAAVSVPVSADVEGGYAADPEGVAGRCGRCWPRARSGSTSRTPTTAAPRRCADGTRRPHRRRPPRRRRGRGAVVRPRPHRHLPAGRGRPGETLERAAGYLAAGADGIFVPGVSDPAVVAAWRGIDAPVGILAGPGAPPVSVLASAGAARVSLGSAVAEAATRWSTGPRANCSPPAPMRPSRAASPGASSTP